MGKRETLLFFFERQAGKAGRQEGHFLLKWELSDPEWFLPCSFSQLWFLNHTIFHPMSKSQTKAKADHPKVWTSLFFALFYVVTLCWHVLFLFSFWLPLGCTFSASLRWTRWICHFSRAHNFGFLFIKYEDMIKGTIISMKCTLSAAFFTYISYFLVVSSCHRGSQRPHWLKSSSYQKVLVGQLQTDSWQPFWCPSEQCNQERVGWIKSLFGSFLKGLSWVLARSYALSNTMQPFPSSVLKRASSIFLKVSWMGHLKNDHFSPHFLFRYRRAHMTWSHDTRNQWKCQACQTSCQKAKWR